jgi:hypothetical protein
MTKGTWISLCISGRDRTVPKVIIADLHQIEFFNESNPCIPHWERIGLLSSTEMDFVERSRPFGYDLMP